MTQVAPRNTEYTMQSIIAKLFFANSPKPERVAMALEAKRYLAEGCCNAGTMPPTRGLGHGH